MTASKTILLTGITGFIAKRIAKDLLDAGHRVRGSLRSETRADEVRAAVGPDGLDRLEFVSLDLTADPGWTEAMAGVDAVLHTASPFPMSQPRDENDLIRPAVDGTLRALRAAEAAGVSRVVLTSSVAAVMYSDGPSNGRAYTAADWTDTGHSSANAYTKSKTLAETAAWDFAEAHPSIRLTTVNPGAVMGRPMDRHYGTSLGLIERILSGRDPMLPDLPLPIVDLADVSALHLAALEQEDTVGRRLLASAGVMRFPEVAAFLKRRHPERRIATRVAPKFMLRGLALFDSSIRGILGEVGRPLAVDASESVPVLGRPFVPAEDGIAASADFVLAHGVPSKAA
ncbi:NAD-dependent epimerase/dehydratase family protein [Histidinibacterium lentulum]|uniref:NAD-dependent epimerase/dehydratase family protein n=1 Tax=Histidinibacterium lentulum TaxID=2480588 RepID=A0A3N2R5L2_9RHOB|nr:NAD-dependent epimerase/dehydratase family protein [Histidinibacterium lentulum]ROU02698.1 NAD-dependent epimerase/dehydratase family protein [Histidinibacterium lentulum]